MVGILSGQRLGSVAVNHFLKFTSLQYCDIVRHFLKQRLDANCDVLLHSGQCRALRN